MQHGARVGAHSMFQRSFRDTCELVASRRVQPGELLPLATKPLGDGCFRKPSQTLEGLRGTVVHGGHVHPAPVALVPAPLNKVPAHLNVTPPP